MTDRAPATTRGTASVAAQLLAALLLAALFVAAALLASDAAAHDMNLARYRIETTASSIQLELDLPATFATSGNIVWPIGCREADRTTTPMGNLVRLSARAVCATPPPDDARILAPWGVDGAVLEAPDGSVTIIAARQDGVALPLGARASSPRPLIEVATEYLILGVVHILEGWDHLAFVLCLFLLASGGLLIALITAFTIGHSVSLALAYTGVVQIPILPTEAVIALSIAFMAREALLHREASAAARRRAWMDQSRARTLIIVIGFGLIHGLGFASVLGDLGVASTERIAGLAAFNIGVEVGQLAFVSVLLVLWRLLVRLDLNQAARSGALLIAGCLGSYWFIERVAGFI